MGDRYDTYCVPAHRIVPFFFSSAAGDKELKREATAAFDIHRMGLNLAFVGEASFDTGLRMDRLFLVVFKMATKKILRDFAYYSLTVGT
jgi:hypothetical protein